MTLAVAILALLTAAIVLATKIVEFQTAREKRDAQIDAERSQTKTRSKTKRRQVVRTATDALSFFMYVFVAGSLYAYAFWGSSGPASQKDVATFVLLAMMAVISAILAR